MFVQCPRCQHALDAAAPNVSCPRCGGPMSAPSSGGVVPRTMAMDPAMVAEALRASQPSAAPLGPQQPVYSAHALGTAPTFVAPPYTPQPSYNAHPFGAQPAYGAQPFGAQPSDGAQPYGAQPYGAQPYGAQPYGAQAQAGPSDRDLAGHAVITVVISALAFLGACNPVGLAGVVLGLMAHNDANNSAPSAGARTRTARLVAITALVLTMLGWVVGVAVLLVAADGA